MPESLDRIALTREALLTDYQNEAYARVYRNVIDRICARETQLAGDTKLPLTRTAIDPKTISRSWPRLCYTYAPYNKVSRM